MAEREGNCYATSEAFYHLMGGKAAGWKPKTVFHEGATHWFVEHESGMIVDLTASQFEEGPPYGLAVGRGFLTKEPSKAAREMMDRMVWKTP